MATWDNGIPKNQPLVKHINHEEITDLKYSGEGTFGVVYRGKWGNTYVAVKCITKQTDPEEFDVEIRQLSRVSHENIVRLYGVSTNGPNKCLVMEYADGGSLYDTLHGKPKVPYTLGHALSWAYQCAKGVEYLHAMQPKPLIHRDLKPPNLVLVMNRLVVKICDFGTAADKRTYMTNNQGSAKWMAPEVFSSSKYTEKCDIFSWSIILWEVLSRQKPFDQFESAYSIMWTVYQGIRPPLIENCPPPIEEIMIRCWDAKAENRPSMAEVVSIMSKLCNIFSKSLPPLTCEEDIEQEYEEIETCREDYITFPSNGDSTGSYTLPQPNGKMSTPLCVEVDENAWKLTEEQEEMELQRMAGLDRMMPIRNGSTNTVQAGVQSTTTVPDNSSHPESDLDNMYLLLESHLRPATPDMADEKSRQLFEQHKQLAQEYLTVQTELVLLSQKKDTLQAAQTLEQQKRRQRIEKLQSEKEQLELLKQFLLNQEGENSTPRSNSDGRVMVNRHDNC